MNQKLLPPVALLGAMLAGVVGWTMLPSLQSSQRAADGEASVHFERARRLLHQFHHGLSVKGLMLEGLADNEVALAASDPDADAEVDEDFYQKLHQDRWSWYQPYDYDLPGDPRPVREARYGNIPGQIRKGIQTREQMLLDNDALLGESLAEVDAGLNVSSGSASARQDAEGNRLRGTILHHTALAECARARVMRRRADSLRRRLVSLAQRFAPYLGERADRGDDDPGDQLASLDAKISDGAQALQQLRATLSDLDDRIADMTTRLNDAEARGKQARREMERIQQAGIDFTNPQGADEFEAALVAQSDLFRKTERAASEIKHGAYAHATIDQSGDFLRGRYIDDKGGTQPAVRHGLIHHQAERQLVTARIGTAEQVLGEYRTVRDALQLDDQNFAARTARKRQEAGEAKTEAGDLYDEMNRTQSEAFAIEDDALAALDRASRALRSAADAARVWTSAGATAAGKVSPAARGRSPHTARSESGWMGGHVNAQIADARLTKAWIEYWRVVDYRRNAAVFAQANVQAFLTEATAQSELAKVAEAHDRAVGEVEEAMSILQRAHRAGGRHWTFVAQAATANDLMVLLGHEQYATDATEAYQAAIEGRENEAYVQSYQSRLVRLRN